MTVDRAKRLWGYAPAHFFCWRCWRALPKRERAIIIRLDRLERKHGSSAELDRRRQRVWGAIHGRNDRYGRHRLQTITADADRGARIAEELGI